MNSGALPKIDYSSLPILPQPPLPQTLIHLEDEQSTRLKILQPHGWRGPKKQCRTCSKENVPAGSPEGAGGIYYWYRPTSGKIQSGSRKVEDVVGYLCDCRGQFRLHQWMAWAGIGLNYMRVDWWDCLDLYGTPAMFAAVDYALNGAYHANAGNNLVFWSKIPGTGKTFLASLLAKRLLLDGLDVYMTSFTAMLDLYTASWRQEQQRSYFDERVRGAQILVIDDIGREYPGRFPVATAMLDSVVRARIANCQPIIVTTNLNEDELAVYGTNVLSLLSERRITVEVAGADKRLAMTERASREHVLNLKRPIVID